MFAHLRLHSEFSVVDSTCRIDEVVKAAAADGLPALAITDLSNLLARSSSTKRPEAKVCSR
jgi:DNA polymerase-3 subunit alpha